MTLALFFILPFIFKTVSSCYSDRIVSTTSGPVQGLLNDENEFPVQVFLGIPFAEPPVGSLRFQKPKPVKPWTKTLLASNIPPACIQYTAYPFPWADMAPGQNEDCLYLNIYAPANTNARSDLAVMFWIYGGGFTYGSNRMDVYDGSALAVYGNVIVVTINYRLGALGFVTSNTEDAPGNVGMYDIVMALQWANDNIESFGGDKKRITVFGESAGSIAISLLCTSPLAKGLFSKAILESGTGIFLKSNQLEPNLALTQRLAEAVGCASKNQTIQNEPQSVIECLRGKEAAHLALVIWSFNPTAARSFFPQYGDDFLPTNALDLIRKGSFHNVPILIGNVKDEGSFQITTKEPEKFGFFGEKNPTINKTQAEGMIRNIFRNFDDPEKYVKHYLDKIPDDDYDTLRQQIWTASGDISLLCETVYFAESYADRGNDVYYYLYTHRPSTSPWSPWMGTVHASELEFVFGRALRKPYIYEPIELQLSMQMIEVWTNFAKNGIPSNSFNWPKYSRAKHTFVYIDTKFNGGHFGIGPHLENCNIVRNYFGF